MTDVQTKPKEIWDKEDRLDFLDGWHEESDAHFHSPRNKGRGIQYRDVSREMVSHTAYRFFELGKTARAEHREATGL